MTDPLLVERDADGIATVTLNRPELRNPITDLDMVEALEARLLELDADLDTRVIILTGAGSAFSSGGNLRRMRPGGGLVDEVPAETRRNYKQGIQRLPLLFERLELPVIAAVNGPAVGAGCDLACMCDLRIASERASFAESFVKLGLISGDGGAWLLPRIVGFSKACEMSFTGDPVEAAEALRFGLVSRVVAPEQLLDEARSLARRIAVNPPHAVRMTKRLLRQGRHMPIDGLLEMSAAMQALAHATSDFDEALDTFLERRPGVS